MRGHTERHRMERIGWLRAAVLAANDDQVAGPSMTDTPDKTESNSERCVMNTKSLKPAEKASAGKPAERTPDEWDLQARNLIKGVMVTRGFRFNTLADRLEELGHPITESALGLRVNRGSFNLGHALLMLRAMGETELSLEHIALGLQWEKA